MEQSNNTYALLKQLSLQQRIIIDEVAQALAVELDYFINPKSDIISDSFHESFSNRIKLYHAVSEHKLTKKVFEYAFWAASLDAGRRGRITENQTNPGADVIIEGTNYSLKTEAAVGINREKITISKFMEARWIRDCTSTEDFSKIGVPRILTHISEYERILILRVFELEQGAVRYDLVEIHKDHLAQIEGLRPEDFSQRTPNGGSSAKVLLPDGSRFTLRLDGSVEKVTISGFPTSCCFLHASWTVPMLKKQTSEEVRKVDSSVP